MRTQAEIIDTHQLSLLPLQVEHAAEMAEVLSDPRLHEFIGGAPASPEALRDRYERLVTGSPDPAVSWWNWVIRLNASSRLTGTVQATITDHGRRAEIAWVVGTPWQGHGIATEATRALVAWLDHRDVPEVVAHIHPDHLASAAVATAIGLRRTEVRVDGEDEWVRPDSTQPA